jgi:hypothetical protein
MMSKIEKLAEQQLTIVNDADLAALAAAARDLQQNDFVGLPLKFAKGKWLVKDGDKTAELKDGDRFIVDVLSYSEGWTRWQDRKPTHRFLARRVDGFISPPRHVLPEADKKTWPAGPKGSTDPWQEEQRIVLRNMATGQLVTWSSGSYGGRIALAALLDAFAAESKQHPGHMPVVELSSYARATDYGPTPTPQLEIVDWQPFGEGASPPGNPARLTATRQALEAMRAEVLALPPPAKTVRDGDLDDEIPF